VNCYVFGFGTLDEILWRFPRGVMHIAFECRIGSDLLSEVIFLMMSPLTLPASEFHRT
jgi:hypothetical protein